jgi:hypothetical protein
MSYLRNFGDAFSGQNPKETLAFAGVLFALVAVTANTAMLHGAATATEAAHLTQVGVNAAAALGAIAAIEMLADVVDEHLPAVETETESPSASPETRNP